MHHVPENTINIMWWKSNVLVFYPKHKKKCRIVFEPNHYLNGLESRNWDIIFKTVFQILWIIIAFTYLICLLNYPLYKKNLKGGTKSCKIYFTNHCMNFEKKTKGTHLIHHFKSGWCVSRLLSWVTRN